MRGAAAGLLRTGRLRIRRFERSNGGRGRQPLLVRRPRLQILNVHFLGHLALIGRLLRKVLRQDQMNRLAEIGNNLGGFPRRRAAQTRQQEHQREDPGVDHERADARPPIPAASPRTRASPAANWDRNPRLSVMMAE